jgi:DNA-binding NarL/FixJ family response regulator
VLIVDDSPDVLRDMRLLLELSGNIEIIGEARDGREAVRMAAELRPEVVVMDLEMPRMNGYEATRQIKAEGQPPRVVILSVHGEPETIECALRAGADGFVLKGASEGILVDAIQARTDSTRKDLEEGSKK